MEVGIFLPMKVTEYDRFSYSLYLSINESNEIYESKGA